MMMDGSQVQLRQPGGTIELLARSCGAPSDEPTETIAIFLGNLMACNYPQGAWIQFGIATTMITRAKDRLNAMPNSDWKCARSCGLPPASDVSRRNRRYAIAPGSAPLRAISSDMKVTMFNSRLLPTAHAW